MKYYNMMKILASTRTSPKPTENQEFFKCAFCNDRTKKPIIYFLKLMVYKIN